MRWFATCATSLLALGVGAPSVMAQGSSYVVNGSPSETCAWPTTVSLGGCTGTLVHPKLVVYAAHCGGGRKTVRFGEERPFARSVATEYCKTYPGGGQPEKGGDHKDYAFCVLKEEVTDVPITPILYGCETEAIQIGAEAVVAGFGATLHGKSDGGIQREVVTTIDRIDEEAGKVSIGGGGAGKGKGSCYGDSGGPLFIQLPESLDPERSWRVFGVTSYGDSEPQCDGQAWYGMMHDKQAVPWIEEESGIDITPCFDVDGTWNPTEECGRFPLDPGATGSWENACQGGPTGKMSSTCGPAFGESEGGEDDDSSEDNDSDPGSNNDSGKDPSKGEPSGEDSGKGGEDPPKDSDNKDDASKDDDPKSNDPQDPKGSDDNGAGSNPDSDDPGKGCSVNRESGALGFGMLLLLSGVGLRRRSRDLRK